MGTTHPVTPMIALARAALREPFSRRARQELLFCLVGALVGLAVLAVIVALLVPGTARSVARAGAIVAVLLPLTLADRHG
jgi:cobalamin biosynthesis protein CobD/CbiB